MTIASSGRRSFGGLLGRAVPATTWSAKSICAGLHYRRPGSDTFTCRVDGHSPTSTTICGGGGALRFEWVPTPKRPRGAEAVNAKI